MKPLWTSTFERTGSTNMAAFMAYLSSRHAISDYDALYRWSIADAEAFWGELWDFAGVVGDKGAKPWLVDAGKMPGARFFPSASLNFAENMLRHASGQQEVVFWGEDRLKARVSAADLRADAGRFRRFLASRGIGVGDRVAAILPNMPQSIVALLGTAALGAVWSSCSPDFGEQGILDRFGQIEPRVLIVCDGYYYNGKTIDLAGKVNAVVGRLPTVERVVVVSYIGSAEATVAALRAAYAKRNLEVLTLQDALKENPGGDLEFTRLPFDHPLCILYSSGTTGVPKCIVHSAGGILLKHRPNTFCTRT